MTALLALSLLAPQAPPVVELVEPEASAVVVQAYVPAPSPMSAREFAAWYVLGGTLLAGSTRMPGHVIADYGGQAGIPPRVEVAPDWMRITFVMPRGGLAIAAQLLEDVLERPALREQDITAELARLKDTRPDVWSAALVGDEMAWDQVRLRDVTTVRDKALQLARMTFAVGGAIEPGQGTSEVQARFSYEGSVREGLKDFGPLRKPLFQVRGGTSVYELTGKPLLPVSPGGPERILASFALGAGKTSSLYRVAREMNGWSYRQEAVLWPTRSGWVPRLMLAHDATPAPTDLAARLREALLADVETWDAPVLARAQAILRAAVSSGFELNPVYVGPERPIGTTLVDRVSLRGYLLMAGAGRWDEARLLDTVATVQLDDLKAEAKLMLEEASETMVLAGG